MKNIKNLKVAIVAEELTQLGGAERVLDAILEVFPKSPIYTLVWDKEKTHHRYDKFDVRPSFIQKLPFGIKKYKWYLPLMPLAIERLNFSNYDIVISLTSALVKGIKTGSHQLHFCYCNTPTRYLWIDSESYLKTAPIPGFIRPFMPFVLKRLRKWDLMAAKRPDFYIANSKNVQQRIKKYYDRDSFVIYPNVDCKKFEMDIAKEDYYLVLTRLEPYKKVDLVIDAFKKNGKKLKVVGSGTKMAELKNTSPKNIEFLGRVSDEELPKVYAKAEAFIFPQDEDFGLTPVEAMAAGTPVIAYKKGGALEIVIEGKTGEFFSPQTSSALALVIKKFDTTKYKKSVLREQAEKFDTSVFKTKLLEYINSKLDLIEKGK